MRAVAWVDDAVERTEVSGVDVVVDGVIVVVGNWDAQSWGGKSGGGGAEGGGGGGGAEGGGGAGV